MSEINWGLLNPNIPAQVADSFQQGRDNALARAAAQQDKEIKSYALAKAQRADQTQSNYLAALAAAGNDHEKIKAATIASGDVKGAYALDKDRADADLHRQKSASYKLDAMGQVAGAILNNPTPENYSYHMDNMVTLGILTPEQAAQQKLIVSQDPSKVTQLATQMRQAGLSAKDQLAKFQIVENGGSTLGLSTDPVSNQTTQTFSIQKTQSPDSIAADGRAEEKLQLQQNPLGLSGYGTPQRPPSSSPSAFIGGVDPSAVIRFESNGNQSAVSPKGATGAMQLMPNTAKGLGVNANDQLENTAGGVAYLSQLRKKYGDDRLALAAYNWGPGNVDNWLKAGADPAKLPAETRNYVNNVLSLSGKNAQQAPATGNATTPDSGGFTQFNSGIQTPVMTVKGAMDANLHGKDFLGIIQKENPGLASRIKEIAEGKMVLPDDKSAETQALSKLVIQYEPKYSHSSKAPTEFQGKSAIYGARAEQADKIITGLGTDFSPTAINAKQGLGKTWAVGGALEAGANVLLPKNSQKAEQAQRDFVNAVMRQESGAAIAPSEFDNAQKQYFPQPGDSDDVIKQKAANRKLAIQGIQQNAGNAAYHAPSTPVPKTKAGASVSNW